MWHVKQGQSLVPVPPNRWKYSSRQMAMPTRQPQGPTSGGHERDRRNRFPSVHQRNALSRKSAVCRLRRWWKLKCAAYADGANVNTNTRLNNLQLKRPMPWAEQRTADSRPLFYSPRGLCQPISRQICLCRLYIALPEPLSPPVLRT